MSYDIVLWLPLMLAGLLAGIFCISTRRPLAAAIINGLIAACFLIKVWWAAQYGQGWVSAYGWATNAVYPHPSGVLLEHLLADGVHQRARWSLALLPFSLPPLLMSLAGATLAAHQRKVRWPLLLTLLCAVPNLVLGAWLVGAALTRSGSDPRWTLDYVQQWQREGAVLSKGGGVCYRFIGEQEALARYATAPELERAREDCQRVCAHFSGVGHFNPGVLEDHCARLPR